MAGTVLAFHSRHSTGVQFGTAAGDAREPSRPRRCGTEDAGHSLRCLEHEVRQTGVTTMKAIGRWIFGALLSLCVLSMIVRGVRADETADSMAEMQRQNDEFNRQAQEEREARDKFNREAYEE